MPQTSATTAREQFDRQAKQYNERWASWSDETLRRMLELADPQPSWRVLDVATGTGFTALAFAPQVAGVVGTDISPGMLMEAAKRAQSAGITNVEWSEAPAEVLPFANASFDLVTCRIAPHHFQSVPAFLAETARVLKPGGVCLIGDTTVPDNDPEAAAWQNAVEKKRDPSHVRNLPPQEWRELYSGAALEVTHLEHVSGAITIALEDWLQTAGCTGERAERVREMFQNAPLSARQHFRIETDEVSGSTSFSWHRVILRGVVAKAEDTPERQEAGI